jgi:hypothetical protein
MAIRGMENMEGEEEEEEEGMEGWGIRKCDATCEGKWRSERKNGCDEEGQEGGKQQAWRLGVWMELWLPDRRRCLLA